MHSQCMCTHITENRVCNQRLFRFIFHHKHTSNINCKVGLHMIDHSKEVITTVIMHRILTNDSVWIIFL